MDTNQCIDNTIMNIRFECKEFGQLCLRALHHIKKHGKRVPVIEFNLVMTPSRAEKIKVLCEPNEEID